MTYPPLCWHMAERGFFVRPFATVHFIMYKISNHTRMLISRKPT